jgi:hypothetical protein
VGSTFGVRKYLNKPGKLEFFWFFFFLLGEYRKNSGLIAIETSPGSFIAMETSPGGVLPFSVLEEQLACLIFRSTEERTLRSFLGFNAIEILHLVNTFHLNSVHLI